MKLKRALIQRFVSVGAVIALMLGTQFAAFADPWPDDASRPEAGPIGAAEIFATVPFVLGEIDLTTLGVPDSELTTVGLAGPVATPAASSSGSLLTVDDDGAQCPQAQFTTIQAAVDAAGPGDEIKVCPGMYPEQVLIAGSAKDGITLFSQVPLAAVIKAPLTIDADPTTIKAIVRISGADGVTIRHFTVSGPGTTLCNSLRYGVRVDMGGSATIEHNHITLIQDSVFSGCQNGIAVQIGRNVEGQIGSGVIRHNLIDKYQKGGIVVDGRDTTAEVRHNEIVGAGPTPITAQNGIQISRRATGSVHHNIVSKNVYTGAEAEATGLLLFALEGGVTASDNKLFENEVGVFLSGGTVFFPEVPNTFGVGVFHNRSHHNLDDGIRAEEDTRDNPMAHNDLFANAIHDCHDDSVGSGTAGTANTWDKNHGQTENRPGLCKAKGNP